MREVTKIFRQREIQKTLLALSDELSTDDKLHHRREEIGLHLDQLE
jgi:hypothetical protein